ncbi:3385_t:CDS:2, partial [Gigaspora margarita]
ATDFEYLTILKDIPIFANKLDHYEQINIFNILERIFDVAILWGIFHKSLYK